MSAHGSGTVFARARSTASRRKLIGAILVSRLALELRNGRQRDEGQGLVEYAFILVLVSVAVLGLLAAMGTKLGATFTTVTNAL
jgi:Flp pilus assembly pilin Flp